MSDLTQTILYAAIGLIIFIIALFIMELVTKFSIKKQIVEEGNIALAIVIAALIASLGMIISAAIH